jgi:hypothetical protein
LHIGLVVFFFILQKQWKNLLGYLLGGVTIVILTLLIFGPNMLQDYLTKDLPRMIRYGGDVSTPEMKLPDNVFENYYNEYGGGSTYGLEKNAHWFSDVHISFSPNAGLPRFISQRMQDIDENWQIPPTPISLLLLALFLPLSYLGLKKIKARTPALKPDQEFLYWYGVLMIILLFGPLTWTMTTIWIIPLVALAVGQNPWSSERMHLVPWLLLVVALFLAFVPDCMYLGWRDFAAPSWGCKMLDSSKYILSELLIIVSIWLHIGGLSLFEKIKQPQVPSSL